MSDHLTDQDWNIRLFIYRFFVEHGRSPTPVETAAQFKISTGGARRAYHRLHHGHAIFLDAGTDSVRMANPLSAVSTAYRVTVGDTKLYANCAWDSLGIPAMLHSDASVEAFINGPDEPVRYAIENGLLVAEPGLVVQFSVPFARWYDNLIHT